MTRLKDSNALFLKYKLLQHQLVEDIKVLITQDIKELVIAKY